MKCADCGCVSWNVETLTRRNPPGSRRQNGLIEGIEVANPNLVTGWFLEALEDGEGGPAEGAEEKWIGNGRHSELGKGAGVTMKNGV